MTEELTALAEAGATAVVAAMATELWQSTRDTVLGLFHRGAPDRRAAVEARLDSDAALVRQAPSPGEVRQELAALWAGELATLLRRDPACRAHLAQLTAGVGGALQDGPGGVVLEQTNTARDSGTVYAVQRGDLHAHRPDTGR